MKLSSLLMTSGLFVAAFSFIQCSSTSSNPVAGKTGDAGTSSAGCQAYCDAITTNCTSGNLQYSDKDHCMSVCTAFPVGAANDTSGNTLGCRTYHANLAAGTAANATTHCPHAGPGGDGVCGKICDGYCQLAEKFCVGSAKIYTNAADCQATCAATTGTARFNVSIVTGDETACLLYHVQEASIDSTHCTDDLAKRPGDAGATTGGSVTCQ